ncbi:DUF4065 domain-containing protein [Fructobacillus sp. M2-14]|uniref:DUF4065 domain-containing protein n=2 Tax=Lactobacillaceae TaxID=33958 RepID=A0ABS5QZ70_9LACO|nr:DUF4065 domain-containing protein [Fructobacillus broussonetiae]
MTPKKLQKLMYYAYSWGLVFLNETSEDLNIKLFDGDFEAWVHGPVDSELYSKYKKYGYQQVEQENVDISLNAKISKQIVDEVFRVYGEFTADQLEYQTHQEEPWQQSRKGLTPIAATNNKIEDATIFDFYGSQLA